MKNVFVVALFAGALSVSCGSGDKANEVTTGEAKDVVEVADVVSYTVEDSTVLNWRGFKSFVASEHVGTIGLESGSFDVKDGSVVGGKFTIDMNSIVNTDVTDPGKNEYLVGHLKSKDFFYVDSFPTAVFEITSVEALEAEGVNSTVKGNLSIRGITNGIEFPAQIEVFESAVAFSAPTFSFDRTKWDVKFHDQDDPSIAETLKDDLIDHKIELTLSINATK